MSETVGAIAEEVRSKNAGPFWVTVDIFCGSNDAYERIVTGLETARVAAAFGTETQLLRRFDIPELSVVKLSLPRPTVQGTAEDRDMHGAGWAMLVAGLPLD